MASLRVVLVRMGVLCWKIAVRRSTVVGGEENGGVGGCGGGGYNGAGMGAYY